MPLLPDGTIVAGRPEDLEDVRFVTRVTLEFQYDIDPGAAQEIHEAIIETVTAGAEAMRDQIGAAVYTADGRIAYAKNPQPVPPEGEVAEEGGSVS